MSGPARAVGGGWLPSNPLEDSCSADVGMDYYYYYYWDRMWVHVNPCSDPVVVDSYL